MNRVAAFILLATICACHKREEATPAPVVTASASPGTIGSAEIQQMVALLHSAAAPSADPDGGEREAFLEGLGSIEMDGGTGLGPVGTLGHGPGYGGIGGNTVHVPSVRQGVTTVNGRLAPEVVQRVIRRSFGRFRACYEKGLSSNPNLAGKVVTKFVIDPKGNVSSAARDAATTITDATVVSCVTSTFSSLSFPEPEGGIVVVTYPMIFAPSD
jgi:hypothetical protein